MSKKTKSAKKHRFKYAQPTTNLESAAKTVESSSPAPAVSSKPAAATSMASVNVDFVTTDLRRLGMLILLLAGLQIGLWLLFRYTTLDDVVYRAISF